MKRKPMQSWLAAAVLVTSLWSGTPAFASGGKEVKLSQSQPEISQAGFDIAEKYAVWINEGENTITLYDIEKNTETKIGNKSSTKKSPKVDGKYVVWLDSRDGGSDVYMYDISKNEETRVTDGSGSAEDVEIAGKNIVWSNKSKKGTDIFLYNISSGEEEQVTTSGKATHPTVSDSYVAWEDSREGNADIYYYDIDAQEETAAVTLRGAQVRPTIYNDEILYENQASDYSQIYVYSIDTGRNKQLTEGSGDKQDVHNYKTTYVYVDDGDLRSADSNKSSSRQIASSIFKGNGPRVYGNYVMYAKKDSDKKLHLNLYDIDERETIPLGDVAGEPSQPDGSDRYVVYISRAKRVDSVVLYDTKVNTSKVISKAKADPSRPLVSNHYVVWYDDSKDALVSYDIRKGVETQITDGGTKHDPSDELYELDGNQLLWLNEGRRTELMLTDLSTGKHESLTSLKSEPLSIDLYDGYVSYVLEQGAKSANIYLYDINRGRETTIRKNVQVEEAKLGDDFVVWSEYTDGSKPNWDLFYYNIRRDKTSSLLRYTDRDQKNPQASRNMVFFRDNRLSQSAKDFYDELYDVEDGSYGDLRWSDKAKVTEARLGGNRIVWVDTRESTPYVYTMEIGSARDDDDNGGTDPEPEPGDYKEYSLKNMLLDGIFDEKIQNTDLNKFVFVFFPNTANEFPLSVKEALKDLDLFDKMIAKVKMDEINIRIYK
ncbi:hypothetical protein [Brevibacillus sp. NRS-1366]|uniref:hypothetical protein n=1 Tax=Brevibacillus sp. NRS-1366 TaxID=3233899 RepID=UPI003D1D84E7